jgi:hypothetical protein
VACIRPADPNEHVVGWCQVRRYLPLPLASVLAPNENVD